MLLLWTVPCHYSYHNLFEETRARMFSLWSPLCSLTQQEQTVAQSQGGWLSPAGGGVVIGRGGVTGGGGGGGGGGDRREGKGVDILQMLTKARTEYDKGGKVSLSVSHLSTIKQFKLM